MQEFLRSSYQGKRVLVTGHTGFKGSWLLALLHRLGANVMGYALAPTPTARLYSDLGGDALCTSLLADVRDAAQLTAALHSFKPDYIFHLAAQPLVRASYQLPQQTFEVNTLGTLNLLEAFRTLPQPCTCVVITTDKVYENREWVYAYRENDALGGHDPYSASKAAAELVVQSYRMSFFDPEEYRRHGKALATARAGNVIGGGDWAEDRLVPDLVRALNAGQPLQVRNPQAIRPWQHVLEPLVGYLQLGAWSAAKPQLVGGAYNFGPRPEDSIPVQELIQQAIKLWGSGQALPAPAVDAPHEAGLLRLEVSRAIAELGWRPRLSASQALSWTLAWYREASPAPLAYTLAQVDSFLTFAHP